MDCSSPDSSVRGIFQARKEYWSGLPLLSTGDLPGLGIELESAGLQADTLPLSHQGSPQLRWEKH